MASCRTDRDRSDSYSSPGRILYKYLLQKEWPFGLIAGCTDVHMHALWSFPLPSSPCMRMGMQCVSRWRWSANTGCEVPNACANLVQNWSCICIQDRVSSSLWLPKIGCPLVLAKMHVSHSLKGRDGQGIMILWPFHFSGRSKVTIFTGNVMLKRKMSLWRLRAQCFCTFQLFIARNISLRPAIPKSCPKACVHVELGAQVFQQTGASTTSRLSHSVEKPAHRHYMPGRISLARNNWRPCEGKRHVHLCTHSICTCIDVSQQETPVSKASNIASKIAASNTSIWLPVLVGVARSTPSCSNTWALMRYALWHFNGVAFSCTPRHGTFSLTSALQQNCRYNNGGCETIRLWQQDCTVPESSSGTMPETVGNNAGDMPTSWHASCAVQSVQLAQGPWLAFTLRFFHPALTQVLLQSICAMPLQMHQVKITSLLSIFSSGPGALHSYACRLTCRSCMHACIAGCLIGVKWHCLGYLTYSFFSSSGPCALHSYACRLTCHSCMHACMGCRVYVWSGMRCLGSLDPSSSDLTVFFFLFRSLAFSAFLAFSSAVSGGFQDLGVMVCIEFVLWGPVCLGTRLCPHQPCVHVAIIFCDLDH